MYVCGCLPGIFINRQLAPLADVRRVNTTWFNFSTWAAAQIEISHSEFE